MRKKVEEKRLDQCERDRYKRRLVTNIVKRSGIARPTVEMLLPAVFDELRWQLTEGCGAVVIEGFGVFYVDEKPERTYVYTYCDPPVTRTSPAYNRLRFKPSFNMKQEVAERKYDVEIESFKVKDGQRRVAIPQTHPQTKWHGSKPWCRMLKPGEKPPTAEQLAAEANQPKKPFHYWNRKDLRENSEKGDVDDSEICST